MEYKENGMWKPKGYPWNQKNPIYMKSNILQWHRQALWLWHYGMEAICYREQYRAGDPESSHEGPLSRLFICQLWLDQFLSSSGLPDHHCFITIVSLLPCLLGGNHEENMNWPFWGSREGGENISILKFKALRSVLHVYI